MSELRVELSIDSFLFLLLGLSLLSCYGGPQIATYFQSTLMPRLPSGLSSEDWHRRGSKLKSIFYTFHPKMWKIEDESIYCCFIMFGGFVDQLTSTGMNIIFGWPVMLLADVILTGQMDWRMDWLVKRQLLTTRMTGLTSWSILMNLLTTKLGMKMNYETQLSILTHDLDHLRQLTQTQHKNFLTTR